MNLTEKYVQSEGEVKMLKSNRTLNINKVEKDLGAQIEANFKKTRRKGWHSNKTRNIFVLLLTMCTASSLSFS